MKIVQQLSLLLVLGGMVPLTATGCIDPSMVKAKKAPASQSDEGDAAPAVGGVVEAPAADGGAAMAQDNTKLVDKKKAMAENPGWVETQNRINATDPVTAASQAYYALPSKAQMLNMKHQIDIIKADNNNRPPTFEEFNKLLVENQVKLKGIYRWQVYAYDDETGDIVILENRAMKKAEYEKAGLKLDE